MVSSMGWRGDLMDRAFEYQEVQRADFAEFWKELREAVDRPGWDSPNLFDFFRAGWAAGSEHQIALGMEREESMGQAPTNQEGSEK